MCTARIGIVIGIVVEIFFLMSTAVRSAIMVSKAIDLRLVPLNAERAFVAKMLVRAALEIGACTLLAPFHCLKSSSM